MRNPLARLFRDLGLALIAAGVVAEASYLLGAGWLVVIVLGVASFLFALYLERKVVSPAHVGDEVSFLASRPATRRAVKDMMKEEGIWPSWWLRLRHPFTPVDQIQVAVPQPGLRNVRHLISEIQGAIDRFYLYKPLLPGYDKHWNRLRDSFAARSDLHDEYYATDRVFRLMGSVDEDMRSPSGAHPSNIEAFNDEAGEAIDLLDDLAKKWEGDQS